MKKLLTIALALVMVLALAAPAMATVGFGPAAEAAEATKTEFTVKIRALEFVPVTSGFTFENNYYADYDATKGIVAGSDIRFVVDVTFPKYGDVTAADEFEKYSDNMNLVVSGNNLAFGWVNTDYYTLNVLNATTRGHEYFNGSLPRVTTNSATKAVDYLELLVDYTVSPWYIPENSVNTLYYSFAAQKNFDDAVPMGLSKYYTTTYSFMFVADVLNTADVTVSAAIDATGYNGQFAKNGTYSFTYGGEVYTVQHTAITGGNYYDMWNNDNPIQVVRFTTDSKDQITNVAVSLNDLASYGYITSVTPLTYAQFVAAQTLVDGIAAGTDAKRIDLADAQSFLTAAQAVITAGTTEAALTANEANWVNSVIKGGKFTTTNSRANVIASITDATATLAEAKALLTPAGQALVTYTPNTKAATMTEALAWAELPELYTEYADLVAALPADQTASAITGVPAGVRYTNDCVPFLAFKDDETTVAHAEWWNVNKDVKLAEIVFNLNDKVHANGYTNTVPQSATDVFKFYADNSDTHGVANPNNYQWCADDTLPKYVEKENVYDHNAVTASKDVNKVIYNKLYPVFNEMMKVLGFEWDGTTAYMYRAAFVEKFGGKLYNEASYTYAAYTSALVVADPNAQPPQTGDTTSILGFVMIAVAVLAAGAVVVKKVRA